MDHCRHDDEYSNDESEMRSDYKTSNRIFLNFTREFTHPERDKHFISKAQDLFATISEMPEMQEMKVSGWLENDKKDSEEEAEAEEEEESKFSEDGSEPKGGHRFAMSRDFWYRKLNTLKARKLDEAALEAKDIPHEDPPKELGAPIPKLKSHLIYSDEIEEKKEDVIRDIDAFEKKIAKPVQLKLESNFVNIYDNRNYFGSDKK